MKDDDKKLKCLPYGINNGIVISCYSCGWEFEETAGGRYSPAEFESDLTSRLCENCFDSNSGEIFVY